MNSVMTTSPILLVEDNPDDIDLALRVMRRCGVTINVTVVRNGAQALEYLLSDSHPDRTETNDLPQLIVLDVNMPKMNGIEVLRWVRGNDRTRHIPVVLLTTSDDEGDVNSGYELGANGYIQKPLNAEIFGRTLDRLGLGVLACSRPQGADGKSP